MGAPGIAATPPTHLEATAAGAGAAQAADSQPARSNRLVRWLVKRPLLLVAISSLGFATQALLVKLLTRRGTFGSFEAVLVRGCCQASGVIAVLTSWGESPTAWLGVTPVERLCLFGRGFFGYGGIAFGFLAIQTTSLANSQVASQVTPVFAALLSRLFLGEPWLVAEQAATLFAGLGVMLVFRPPFLFGASENHTARDVLGIGFALVGSLCAAAAYILIRYMGTRVKIAWPKLMLAQAVGQIALSAPSLYLAGQAWVAPSLTQWAFLGGCGALGFMSQVCMTIGMQRSKSAVSSLVRQSGLIYAFIYQLLLVPSEHVTISTYIGAAVIVVSVGCLAVCKAHDPSPASPASPLDTEGSRTRSPVTKADYSYVGNEDAGDEVDRQHLGQNPMHPAQTVEEDGSDDPSFDSGIEAVWQDPVSFQKRPFQAMRTTLLQMVPLPMRYTPLDTGGNASSISQSNGSGGANGYGHDDGADSDEDPDFAGV